MTNYNLHDDDEGYRTAYLDGSPAVQGGKPRHPRRRAHAPSIVLGVGDDEHRAGIAADAAFPDGTVDGPVMRHLPTSTRSGTL